MLGASFCECMFTSSDKLWIPPRSCHRLDDGHVTTAFRRRSGELISQVVVHSRFSHFHFDGTFSLESNVLASNTFLCI